MPFRLIAAEPHELQKLADAFDAAWTAVNYARPVDPSLQAEERERLGRIIVQIWEADAEQCLAAKAVRLFLQGAVTELVRTPDITSTSGTR